MSGTQLKRRWKFQHNKENARERNQMGPERKLENKTSNEKITPRQKKTASFLSILSDVKNSAAMRKLGRTRHSQPGPQSGYTHQLYNT